MGIETLRQHQAKRIYNRINRTSVELKQGKNPGYGGFSPGINRTSVELKQVFVCQYIFAIQCINRTSVELKHPKSRMQYTTRCTVLIAPVWN